MDHHQRLESDYFDAESSCRFGRGPKFVQPILIINFINLRFTIIQRSELEPEGTRLIDLEPYPTLLYEFNETHLWLI